MLIRESFLVGLKVFCRGLIFFRDIVTQTSLEFGGGYFVTQLDTLGKILFRGFVLLALQQAEAPLEVQFLVFLQFQRFCNGTRVIKSL